MCNEAISFSLLLVSILPTTDPAAGKDRKGTAAPHLMNSVITDAQTSTDAGTDDRCRATNTAEADDAIAPTGSGQL